MKKILLVLLTVIFLCLITSCSSVPTDTGDFTCSFDTKEKTATIDKYNGNDSEIVIPDYFGKYRVTKIGTQAFSEQYEITSVKLPNLLETIELQAFRLCISLEKIIFPETLTTIGNAAFSDCRSLTNLSIPKNVDSIGIGAFSNCYSLEKIIVDKNNTTFSSDEYGVLIMNSTTILQYPPASKHTEYKMPDGIKKISSNSFAQTSNLEKITFSSSLETIESNAFKRSGITSAIFGDNLKTIGSYAFSEATITTLQLGKNVETIEHNAFEYCPIDSVHIPSSTSEIGSFAFADCSFIKEFTVDDQNEYYTADKSGVLFTKDMKTLLYYPSSNPQTEYTIPNGVETVSDNAFKYNLNLKKVVIPNSVETVGQYAFAYCIYLEDVVYEGTQPEDIADNAFEIEE